MKILSVNIEESHKGLKPIKMQKLGDVVILAGKNGSGKTRILNLIMERFNKKMGEIPQIQAHRNNIKSWQKHLGELPVNHPDSQNYINAIENEKRI